MLTLRPEMTSAELHEAFSNSSGLLLVSHAFVRESERGKQSEAKFKVGRDRCFLRLEKREGDTESLYSPAYGVAHFVSELIHVPALRGNRERHYSRTGVGPTLPGTFENYVASMISKWEGENNSNLDLLNQALESLGLTWKITAIKVAETRFELRVGRLAHSKRGGDNDLVNIADVGFGVSQTVPVLVALLAAKPGQAVYLEEPETHLHPNAQRRMARILADAAASGAKVIAETHSSLLLRSVQTLVAAGELAPELVKLHWFTRNEKDGATEIHSADLDENGAFGDWPIDFDEVELIAAKEYLDAVEVRGGE